MFINEKNIQSKPLQRRLGFSLAEMLAALTIAAMVLVAVLAIYSRAETSAATITRKLDEFRLPSEVLQRIAEDLDRMVTPGSDTRVIVENKIEKGYPTARLRILNTIYDGKNKKQTFEEITWQGSFDNDANGLVLYRSHTGIALEDKLLDEQRKSWEKGFSFVPVCTGVTFLKIQVPGGKDFLGKWTSSALPRGVVVTISFAEPFKTLQGTLDVPENEKTQRTITLDRTRKVKFIFVRKEDEGQPEAEPSEAEREPEQEQ